MKTVTKLFAIVLVLGLFFGFLPASSVNAATLDVCPSGCTYTAIQTAINAANTGDTIHVAAGTYNEQITINKQLTLVGTNAIIDGGGNGPVVMILASGTSFSGFTVRNAGTDPVAAAAIGLFNVTNCTIQGNTTSNNFYGIALQNSDTNIIRENMVTGSSLYGIYVGYNANGASTGNTIDDNTILSSGLDGIYLDIDSHANIVTNNGILNTVGGLNNDGYPEGNGIYLWKAASATITGNTISGNARYGIEMMGSANNTITGNNITGNLVGIEVRFSGYPEGAYPSSPNTIIENKIYSNTDYNLFAVPEVTSVTANNNWWGTANLPLIDSKVSGAVTYVPYYIDEAMTILSNVAPATVFVDDSYIFPDCDTHICGYDAFTTVEEGVAAVAAGGTVNVAEGTYNPSAKISLSKAITISGPTNGEAKVIGVGGLNLTVFEITSSNVTIQNLTLTLASPPLAHIGIIHAPDGAKTNINITGNTIYVDPQAGAMSTWWGQAVYLGRYTTSSNVSDNLIYNMRGGVVVAYNSALTISNNVIYNTKGGIMNYTGTVEDADARVITGNSWNDIHNEWDIVWNSGGGPYVMDMDKYVLQLSKANSDAHVVSQMTTGIKDALTGNRSHAFVATTGTIALNPGNGNINLPYAKIQDGINAVVPGGTVYVAAGSYDEEDIQILKGLFLLGAGAANTNIAPSVVTNNSTIVVSNPLSDVLIDGFTFTMQPKPNYGSAIVVTGTAIPVDSATVTISNNVVNGSDDGSKSDYGFYGQGNNARLLITNNVINKTGDNPIVMENQAGSTTVSNNTFYVTSSPDYNPYFSMAYNGTSVTTPQIVEDNIFHMDHSGSGYAEAITFDTAVWNAWNGVPSDTGHYSDIQINNNKIYTEGTFARGIGLFDLSSADGFGTISGAEITGNQIIGENLTDDQTFGITLRGDIEGTLIQNNSISDIKLGIWYRVGANSVCPSGTDLDKNKLVDLGTAIQNDCTVTADASPTWWGSAAGPDPATIIGPVNYVPWCTDATCADVYGPVKNVTRSTYFGTIQAAIDDSATQNGDVISVFPGTYNQDEANGFDAVTGGAGSSNFNIFVNKSVTIQGVKADGTVITDKADIAAFIVPKRDTPVSNLSTFFIQADNVTISGLDITAFDDPDYNFKTISVIGNNVTIKNSIIHAKDQVSSIYMYDPRYVVATDTSYITSYRIEGNTLLAEGIYASGIRISSGPGWTGDAANRVITGNTFTAGSYGIEFVGPGGESWDVYPVGAATVAGNSFSGQDKGSVVAWGKYNGIEGYGALDWDGIFTGNTFDKSVLVKTSTNTVRSYDTGSFYFIRGIYSAIQRYPINFVAQNGDTILVGPGTYVENVLVNKSVTIDGAGATTIVMPAISNPGVDLGGSLGGSNVFLVQADNVKITDLVIDGDNPNLVSDVIVGGADLDARNGIITNHAVGTFNGLEVSYVTVKNIYLRGIYASSGGTFNIHHNMISNTQGSDQSFAIMVYQGTGFVADNVINFGSAVGANYSQGTQWLRNTLTNTPGGIHTDNAGSPSILGTEKISGNTVDCTGVSNGYGLWTFNNYMPVIVENNTATGCAVAYSAMGSANATAALFQNNTATAPSPNTNSVGIYVTTSLPGWGTSNVNANFTGNNLSGFDVGVYLDGVDAAKTITSTIKRNNVTGSTGYAAYQGTTGSYVTDLTENWWGSILGPQTPISEGLDVIQWCGTANPACLPLMPQSGTTLTLNGTEDLDGARIYVPGLTISLANGANIANAGGPCFTVNADHTTIKAATKLGAKCTPATGFNGIDVATGLTDVRIANLEFAGMTGTDGIHFAGVTNFLAIYDNWFHNLAGDAIDFGSFTPTGDVFIQGNLFEMNTGLGIRADGEIPAEHNSWGHIDGALVGDGASSSVDWTPWTHVDLYLGSPTAPVIGQPITFTVYGNLKNVMGADFTLKFPADKLTYVTGTATGSGLFTAAGPNLFTVTTGAIRFNGIAPSSTPISGVDAPIFSVTFLVNGDGALLDLDETTDLFSMVPALTGPSTNIYALKLIDAVATTATYTVKGTFYMQGHYGDYTSGIPGTLTGLVNGIYKNPSITTVPNNMIFNYVTNGTYTFTTLQPRYLNITPDLAKNVTVDNADVTFAESLVLLGGNAVWTDNLIDVNDASAVGTLYGIGTIADNADVTFDNKVDILDLSLVGANMDKYSADAYKDWDPQ